MYIIVWPKFVIICIILIKFANCHVVSNDYNDAQQHKQSTNTRINPKILRPLETLILNKTRVKLLMNSKNNYNQSNYKETEMLRISSQIHYDFNETVIRRQNRKLKNKNKFNYDSEYHSYRKIMSELKSLNEKQSNIVTVVNIGQSFEGRLILGVILSDNNIKNKSIMVLECGIHGREWISTATCLWIIDRLIHDNSLLSLYEIVIIPLVNPDGYAFTWTTNRMWRKSRSKSGKSRSKPKSKCFGVDLNRNWDTKWCQTGSSREPCSDIYCGKHAFSEPETKSLSAFLNKRRNKIAAYFSLHSFSQLWFYSLGDFNHTSKDENFLENLSKNATKSMYKVHHKIYNYGSVANILYPVSGSSIDWVYDKLGVKLSFGIELRDDGHYGFRLPPKFIKPTAEEVFEGIKTAVTGIRN